MPRPPALWPRRFRPLIDATVRLIGDGRPADLDMAGQIPIRGESDHSIARIRVFARWFPEARTARIVVDLRDDFAIGSADELNQVIVRRHHQRGQPWIGRLPFRVRALRLGRSAAWHRAVRRTRLWYRPSTSLFTWRGPHRRGRLIRRIVFEIDDCGDEDSDSDCYNDNRLHHCSTSTH